MIIKNLILDLDGVLTDGKMYVDSKGEKMFKAFHSRDIRAIRELVSMGIRVIVLSADDWEGSKVWCENTGAEFYCARDKLEWVKESKLEQEKTAVIGDDSWDISLLYWAQDENAFAPSDALLYVFDVCPHVKRLEAAGGHGVVAEFLGMYAAQFKIKWEVRLGTKP